jgi:hypothetical protein
MLMTLVIAVVSVAFALLYGIIFGNAYPTIDVLGNPGLITLCAFGGVVTTLLIYGCVRLLRPAKRSRRRSSLKRASHAPRVK